VTEDGHRQALKELRAGRSRLKPDRDIRLYTEAAFGIGTHLVSLGAQRRFGVHREQHQGMARWLRDHREVEAADLLAELEQLRLSRWYGRQGNGEAARRMDELLDALATWAMA
jgi:hypothetical protein